MADWISRVAAAIPLESLPESYRVLAEIAGMEITLRLAEALGGTGYYYVKLDAMLRNFRDEMIRAEFNGTNHRALARSYNLTESWIREIVKRKPDHRQIGLFEEGE